MWIVEVKTGGNSPGRWWVMSTDQEILDGKVVLSNLTPALWKVNSVANRIAGLMGDLGIKCNVVAFTEEPI